jgi:hypothetical protein
MTEYAATHHTGAIMIGSFVERTAFDLIAQGGKPLGDIIEHCRHLLHVEEA